MCVIILAPDAFPSEELIRATSCVNKDGAGIAWVDGDKVKFSKGYMSADEILQFKHFTKPPYLIHFRLATQGGGSPELAHPFSIDIETADDIEGECSGVLAHNGTWPREKWEPFLMKSIEIKKDKIIAPKGGWSDSKAIAYLYKQQGDTFLNMLNEKVATLTPKEGLLYWGTASGEKGWNEIKDNGEDVTVSNIVWKKKMEGSNGSYDFSGVC